MRALRIIAGFIIAALAGYIACFAVYIAATYLGFHDREGAMAMGVAFMIGPAVALISGVIGAIWAGRRSA